mmetsp:Transcript_73243/g.237247  ORF Transcript_73243/g.237247 Transcript_73243/m.237247 type:complete len:258 (-) Transcript_73243:107-880(-)
MRQCEASALILFSAMNEHCSKASSSSMPLTFSPGLISRRMRPSFCLSVMCAASSCRMVTCDLVASTQMHFCARIGNSSRHLSSAWATMRSSVDSKSRMSLDFSFLASGASASGAARFRVLTNSGMITRFSARNDLRSLFSRSTIQRSPCQLKTSPFWRLYLAAPVRPWTTTRLPGSSSAGLRLAGLREICAPLLTVTVTRSSLPGLGPWDEQYCSLSSGLEARAVICACAPLGKSRTSISAGVPGLAWAGRGCCLAQ